jgi:hypothetical protein
MKKFLPLFVLFLLAITFSGFAQSASDKKDTTLFVIKTINGAEYLGHVLSDDGRELFIETNTIGKLYLHKNEVVSMQKVVNKQDVQEKIEAGNYQKPKAPEDIFTTRYIFTTNALPISKGANYGMTNIHGPEIHFSVTDRLNVGIMTSWIGSPLILATKYTFKKSESKLNFALGTLLGTSGFLNQGRGYMGLHWGTVTFGDRENNISLSAGGAYFNIGNEVSRITNKGYGIYNNVTKETYYYSNNQTNYSKVSGDDIEIGSGLAAKTVFGPMLGIAGIKKIGAKTSFVLDNILYIYKHEYLYKTSTVLEYVSGTDPNGNSINSTTYSNTYDFNKSLKTVVILMPGIRVQSSLKSAFQFALPIIQVYGKGNRKNVNDKQAKFLAFPAPMLTIFFKF